MNSDTLYTCQCCGYKTKTTQYYGSYEICPVCYWEDDQLQTEDPNMPGGANKVSLYQAQKNFKEFGACEIDMIKNVLKDKSRYELDINWKPFHE